MKPRLYLETTIPSYLTARPSRDVIVAGHQQTTREWWDFRREAFEVFISQFVIDEASAGDGSAAERRMQVIESFAMLAVTPAAIRLASALLNAGLIPEKAKTDAAHIALSAVHRMDFLMTWNCTHIANAMMMEGIRAICQKEGFSCPVICTPEFLMQANDDR